ncbi:PKD domain-containing protein [Chryseobacterium salviniae]|uniref:PKD domain-containing protein n=1 Tax=Chryseobacterium salviniae TaxID=3101750 RepID=A0ABU6HNL9_9FLAO|nr:PKD domain-containing protein [Chryseobacterium sp. T9W2-O]MEC3874181.1 PKD domain-containing protein [Chryseobacterium sp. T9W2-O]
MKKRTTFLPNIDPRIYLSFGFIFIISLIFLLYQYLRHVDCENANFYIHADEYIVNKVVEFNDNTPGANSWEWDFGDNTPPDRRQRTLHYYKKPGEYIVKLKINGNCVHEKLVTITSISQQNGYLPIIMAPDVATVGDPVYFNAEKEGGESWEWSFGETGSTDALEKSPVYRFKTTGDKKITLIVNGDVEHTAVKTVYVAPKAIRAKQKIDIKSYEFEKPHSAFSLPPGESQKDPLVDMLQYIPVSPKTKQRKDSIIIAKKAPEISNEQFRIMLGQVAAQSKTKDDFKEYLCEKYDIPVVINDKKLMPFEQFCQEINGKKIKITALRINKDTKNCIQNINIHYKVKKWMIWIEE